MASEKLGLKECISIALGGMVGGGIFAVLGVVAQIVHDATWFAFVLAGLVAGCSAYSYNVLSKLSNSRGGSVTFIQTFTGKTKLAGMAGWAQMLGYVGSMAMYAYAFGSFSVGFEMIPDTLFGLPVRPFISVLVVLFFLVLNLMGAKSTGTAENIMVAGKVMILFIFGAGGLIYGFSNTGLEYGFSRLLSLDPLIAAAVSFVAFQGWQLLYYDQESVSDPDQTIPKAVYIAIGSALVLYILVAVSTLNLVPLEVIKEDPEQALAIAAKPFIPMGFTIISLAALFSTGSAINATLFSGGYFAKGMISSHLLPDNFGDAKEEGIPSRSLCILAGVTAVLAAYGSLSAITSFASLAFIIIFGGISYLAFRQRRKSEVHPWIPALGITGSMIFFISMLWYLYNNEPHTFYSILIITGILVTFELLYFERNVLKEKIVPSDS